MRVGEEGVEEEGMGRIRESMGKGSKKGEGLALGEDCSVLGNYSLYICTYVHTWL